MKLKITTLAALITASTCIYAAPMLDTGKLAIANNTTRTLSFGINNICSKDVGNVYEYGIKTISIAKLKKSCAENNTCNITGYDLPSCAGNAVGGITIDFANQSITVNGSNPDHISVAGSIGNNEYNVIFDEHSGSGDSK